MLFAGEVVLKRYPQPPVSIQSTSPLHVLAVITPLICFLYCVLRVCLCLFVCFHLQSLLSFLCRVLIQVYICQDFLSIVFLYLVLVCFALRLC